MTSKRPFLGLPEALDTVGRVLEGNKWTGNEAEFDPSLPPPPGESDPKLRAWLAEDGDAHRTVQPNIAKQACARFMRVARATLEVIQGMEVQPKFQPDVGLPSSIPSHFWPDPASWDVWDRSNKYYTKHMRFRFATGRAMINDPSTEGHRTHRSDCGRDTLWHAMGGIDGEIVINRGAFEAALDRLVAPERTQVSQDQVSDVHLQRTPAPATDDVAATAREKASTKPRQLGQPKASTIARRKEDNETVKKRRRKSAEDKANLLNRIRSVLAAARRVWPEGKNYPGHRPAAEHLTGPPDLSQGYKIDTLRQILNGTYSPMKRLDIPGF